MAELLITSTFERAFHAENKLSVSARRIAYAKPLYGDSVIPRTAFESIFRAE